MNSLFFSKRDFARLGKGLTFNDVLMVPNHSEISSRKLPVLKTKVSKNFSIDIPMVSSNMDTITELEMAKKMMELGGLGVIHRFVSVEKQVEIVKDLIRFREERNLNHLPISASTGVKQEGMDRARALVDAGVDIMTLDIAHGDSVMMLELVEFMKKNFPKIDLIAGNVATPQGCQRLIDAGADSIKVGIGPGSMCTTRIITGCGIPQLSAVAICSDICEKHGIPLIADGGLKTSGDIAKALSAGADCVMLGSMLSGTLETPGEMKSGKKLYRGMASKSAQVSWRGEMDKKMAAEGESTYVACKGSVQDIIDELCGGLSSAMTYINAMTINEMKDKALFIEMTNQAYSESTPHGVMKS